jgi:O-antigen/teichoic acid export membrane protein
MQKEGRTQRFLYGLVGSYGVIAAGVVYTLVSIPLVLKHIGLAELGLWSLSLQVAAYWSYIDLGVSQGLVRLLVEEKDRRRDGWYAALFNTAGVVAVAVCAASVLGCIASGWAVSRVLRLSQHEAQVFQTLYWCSGLVAGIQMLQRRYAAALLAHQRMDSLAKGDVVNLVLMLVVLWTFLKQGFGVMSLAAASVAGALWTLVYSGAVAGRHDLTPRRGEGATFSLGALAALWRFGREVLMLGFGTQVRNTVAVVALGRWVGAEAVGTWNVCTKAFVLIQQLNGRILDVGVYPLMELWSGGNRDRVRERFSEVVVLSGAVGAILASNWAVLNQGFLLMWTGGSVHWDITNDLLFAAWVALAGINRCLTGFSGVSKVFTAVRWFPWLEAATTVVLSFCLAPSVGLPGILLAMLLANLLFEGLAGALYLEKAVGLTGIWHVGIARAYLIAAGCLGTMVATAFTAMNMAPGAVWAAAGMSALICVVWAYLMTPHGLRSELLTRISQGFGSVSRL